MSLVLVDDRKDIQLKRMCGEEESRKTGYTRFTWRDGGSTGMCTRGVQKVLQLDHKEERKC